MDPALLEAVVSGDRQALSRAITLVEDGHGLTEADRGARPAPVIGITGPPGAGKSSLISSLIGLIRRRGDTVAVLAVDPSSPITGGAILGDRIRMQGHTDDQGVYIRSMAARGHLGGLSPAAADTVRLMEVAGFDMVIVETVGVGQSEVEVMGLADAVVLVVDPSWGDAVQAEKAGVVEIANLVVVNKGDRPGVEAVKRALADAAAARQADVLVTTAASGEGMADVLVAIDRLAGR